MSDNNELGILARRKIEAEIIKPIYEILVREIGKPAPRRSLARPLSRPRLTLAKRLPAKNPTART